MLSAGQLQVADLVCSLREVAHSDAYLAHHLWVLVFPIVWATLSEKKEQQVPLQHSAHTLGFQTSSQHIWTHICLFEHCTVHHPSEHLLAAA